MNKINKASRAHCLLLPFPAQGHINPILQFSKLFQHQGVKITLVSTLFYSKSLHKIPSTISFETISDGFDKGGISEAENYKAYFDRFRQVGAETLSELIEKLGKSGNHVDCIIYDPFLPWVLDIAKRFGIIGAVYLTQNMNVNNIYYHVQRGKLQVPLIEHEISLPGLPKLQLEDMPSFFLTYEEDPTSIDFLADQFTNIEQADWIFSNAFYELDKEIADWTIKTWPKFRTVGPNIPSMFLDNQQKDEDYGVAQYKSEKKSNKGLVVTWCFQLQVLAHEAVGCFVTHCGWNSTLEALCLGVPLVAIPQWSDQTTNAKYIVDVWKVGIRATFDEKKIVRQEVLKHCIREILESGGGKEMKTNAMQLKNLAAKAVNEGGSSHKNITEFVNSLFLLQPPCPEL